MPRLHLGVASVPYSYGKSRSTKQVADILESRYQLFSAFFYYCAEDIAEYVGEEMALELEVDLSKRVRSSTLMPHLGPKVERRFREFIDRYEAERAGIPGTPTKAAVKGIRHIGKKRVRAGRRPSFKDSSLLRNNFRAWVTK